ncbi:1,4-alpha-glucan branching protein GlgB [Reinekea marina]|uniref:1,4-alpha-glucan branching enzyme GlgB n=1 Tax=Reinekea marina TaxID=1310421 RepID=A0ABV7WTA3_9GAMM|nr:1,4-alpha-glucan branching protein GlgB [Reinekea marina]MDN3648076.1 1,4-alpha-glucan branching protein GlgB [Reinekea marina]
MSIASRLSNVLEAEPFDVLGVFDVGEGWLIRAFVPDAETMEVFSLDGQSLLMPMKQVDSRGVFECTVKSEHKPLYSLAVSSGGHSWRVVDAYQFRDRAMTDFTCDSATLYKNMGAHRCHVDTSEGQVEGVRFAVYAPNARAVSVIGEFNNYDGRRHPMQSSDDGIWRLFVPGLQAGDTYKFELKDAREHVLPHKSDPYNFYCGQHPHFNSIVFDHDVYQWQDQAWQNRPFEQPNKSPISTYEVHIGSWRHKDGQPLSYRELAQALIPYLVDMNYTHVEFVPVSEHPFDGSWGYQPLGLFAPTSRFGTPDDFKFFVDQCHQHNIAVLVDWVPAHFPADPHGLGLFDGTPLYEYADPRRGWHPDWNSHIYDYGRFTVRDFLISSAVIWLDYFHVDGIRVDAVASMLYLDYSRNEGEWIPNVDGGNHNYEAIEFIKRFNETIYGRYPNAITIAEESTAFDGVTRPVYAGGLGFGFKWNMGWMNDSLNYMQRDPIHRCYHHNDLTFSLVYSFNENFVLPLSHDEVVHGKGSLITKMPGDDWQKFANLRAYYGFMYAHPGKKLNFMGNEIAQRIEWNHRGALEWQSLEDDRHKGIQSLIKDLNRLYKEESALHQGDSDASSFRWINHDDSQNCIFSFIRYSDDEDFVVVVSNMMPSPHSHYRIGVPMSGCYQLLLNTDSHFYGGSNYDAGSEFYSIEDPTSGLPHAIDIKIPPLATVFIKRVSSDND